MEPLSLPARGLYEKTIQQIENAVIPYISGITAFHSAGFEKARPVTHLTRYTLTRLFVPHW